MAELERQIGIERTQHAATRRALQEVQAAAQSLQTRLVHAGLAHRDALSAAQHALGAALERAKAATPVPRKVARKSPIERLPRNKEPKPVKWWTPVPGHDQGEVSLALRCGETNGHAGLMP